MANLRSMRDGQIRFTSGDGTPKTHVFEFDGELTIDVQLYEVTPQQHRGAFPTTPEFIKGADVAVAISFNAMFRELTDASAKTAPLSISPWDIIKGTGYFGTGWASTVAGSPKKCFHFAYSADGGSTWETYRDCYAAGTLGEKMEGSQVAFKLTCPHPVNNNA